MSQHHPWLLDGHMFAYHPSTNIKPDNEPTIDPQLLQRSEKSDREAMTALDVAINNFFEPIDSNESLHNAPLPRAQPPPATFEQLISPNTHAGVQGIEQQSGTEPTNFLKKNLFDDAERIIFQQYSHETPSSVMERVKELNPATTHSYKQVKGAVENERRKKNRRKDNGRWTEEELQLIAQNMDLKPAALLGLLVANVSGFAKNVDQVKDMRSQIVAQKKKGKRAKQSAISGGAAFV